MLANPRSNIVTAPLPLLPVVRDKPAVAVPVHQPHLYQLLHDLRGLRFLDAKREGDVGDGRQIAEVVGFPGDAEDVDPLLEQLWGKALYFWIMKRFRVEPEPSHLCNPS